MSDLTQDHEARRRKMRQLLSQAAIVVLGLAVVVALSRWMDARKPPADPQLEEQSLYVTGATARRMSIGFNGMVADWYWMRALQYVGNKVIEHPEQVQIDDLSALKLHLLYPLLDTATTLDPQFMAVYDYGGVVLPAVNQEDAIKLLRKGIAANPDAWRLYQHLGYIYWKRGDYRASSEAYGAGARLSGAPEWMSMLSARLLAEGDSRETAREMYKHMLEQADDEQVKEMLARRLLQVDSFDERDAIRKGLESFRQRTNRCPSKWQDVAAELRAARLANGARLRFDQSGAPLDPTDAAYLLIKDGCDVDLDWQRSKVPYK
jgi:tetratricopeptide (TPR) repeat protein